MRVAPARAEAAQLSPLTPIEEFYPPQLSPSGPCSLGAALGLLNDSLDHDLIPDSVDLGRYGDRRPIVLIFMGDGNPKDEWQPQLKRLLDRKPQPMVWGIAAGNAIDNTLLQQLAPGRCMTLDAFMRDNFPRGFFLTHGVPVPKSAPPRI